MPTIYTLPPEIVYAAGKGIGQIAREQEAYERAKYQARMDILQKQQAAENEAAILGAMQQPQEAQSIRSGGRVSRGFGSAEAPLNVDEPSALQQEQAAEKAAREQRIQLAQAEQAERNKAYLERERKLALEKAKGLKQSKRITSLKQLYRKYQAAGEQLPSGLQREIKASKISKEELQPFASAKTEKEDLIETPDKAYIAEAEAKVNAMEEQIGNISSDAIKRKRIIAMANKLKQSENKTKAKTKSKKAQTAGGWWNTKK